MTATPIPATPDWYESLLEKIKPSLTAEEYLEMGIFREYFRNGIATARMTPEKISGNLGLFLKWLRRKLMFSREHHGLFLRRISSCLGEPPEKPETLST